MYGKLWLCFIYGSLGIFYTLLNAICFKKYVLLMKLNYTTSMIFFYFFIAWDGVD